MIQEEFHETMDEKTEQDFLETGDRLVQTRDELFEQISIFPLIGEAIEASHSELEAALTLLLAAEFLLSKDSLANKRIHIADKLQEVLQSVLTLAVCKRLAVEDCEKTHPLRQPEHPPLTLEEKIGYEDEVADRQSAIQDRIRVLESYEQLARYIITRMTKSKE